MHSKPQNDQNSSHFFTDKKAIHPVQVRENKLSVREAEAEVRLQSLPMCQE
jgi:hypothetical protein